MSKYVITLVLFNRNKENMDFCKHETYIILVALRKNNYLLSPPYGQAIL
jgi:hypothetical protein